MSQDERELRPTLFTQQLYIDESITLYYANEIFLGIGNHNAPATDFSMLPPVHHYHLVWLSMLSSYNPFLENLPQSIFLNVVYGYMALASFRF